jgi:starch synthase
VLTHGTVFVCPSIYEPLGIVNLEAMACETAVVASDVGGIPEVVADGDTGLLVHYDEAAPIDFEADFATAVNSVLGDPARAHQMGVSGRQRAVAEFGWDAAARKTMDVYESVL